MQVPKAITLVISHGLAIAFGFALGIYALPILIAPEAPGHEDLARANQEALYFGEFSRDREDSDGLHWGEGEIALGPTVIAFSGKLAPGPDYKLYLSPEFVETEADFNRLKPSMVRVGDVETFDDFVVPVPQGIDPAEYTAVIVWCETFGQFITSASYQRRNKEEQAMNRTAACSCGQVTVEVSGDPAVVFACHCDFCQKTNGSIGVFGAVYPTDNIVSMSGETTLFDDFPKWPGLERHFCPRCGTIVYWINPIAFPDSHVVAVGCFADADFPGPSVQVQTQHRHRWCGDFEGAQTYPGFPA